MTDLDTSLEAARHSIAVYSAPEVAGDPDWPAISRQVGAQLAAVDPHMVIVATAGEIDMAFIAAAADAGADLTIIADEPLTGIELPPDADFEVIADDQERRHRVAELAHGFVGLPCSLRLARELYYTWVVAGGGSSGKPVALLNRNRAYEVLRGYTQDVLNTSLANIERLMVFAETPEELVAKLTRQLEKH